MNQMAVPEKDTRVRLPDRRVAIRDLVIWFDSIGNKRKLEVSFGFNERGQIKEVFCLVTKDGSDMQSLVHDACIAASRALQRGDTISEIAKSFSELRDEGQALGRPASPMGALARAGAALEAELWGTK